MTTGIDHLGIAVTDLEAALSAYRALGLSPTGTEEVADQKVRIAFLPCGESRIELLESTDPEGPIAAFIARRGPGIHHVALAVTDLEATLAELTARSIRLIDTVPRVGAGGSRIAFVHPSATGGVLVELCEHPGADH